MGDFLKNIAGKVKNVVDAISSSDDQEEKTLEQARRKEEYAGNVVKCPHCGATMTHTEAICPQCKNKITGRKAVSSVQIFAEELMNLERKRRKNLLHFMGDTQVDPVDSKKLALIQSFPIPNTIDDILEFMLLAIANIDVSLSKNTFSNRAGSKRTAETSNTILRSISNAWLSKMQQAYQKAELMFPDDPLFFKIQKIYFEKMRELKFMN